VYVGVHDILRSRHQQLSSLWWESARCRTTSCCSGGK